MDPTPEATVWMPPLLTRMVASPTSNGVIAKGVVEILPLGSSVRTRPAALLPRPPSRSRASSVAKVAWANEPADTMRAL